MNKTALIEKTAAAHRSEFGSAPESTAWAPGRIEVLGNHTDYNDGTVLSAAINFGHCFCISRSSRPGIRLLAVDVGRVAEFNTEDVRKVPGLGWADYVKGVFFLMQKRLETSVEGLDCTFLGNIPMGAGLSSSAALEVAAATALLRLLGRELDKKETGRLCREAEHRFAGTNCGLLDQFSCLFGCDHGLIHSDFRTLDISPVQLPDDVAFLAVNPHVKHSLADSPYNERRERCEQAAVQLGRLLPHPVTALRDVSPAEFAAHRSRIAEGAARRAAHVIGEIDRVERGVEFLRAGNITGFGRLLFESHQSSIENFENSCPELDVIVDAARKAGALGARLSGGGFGGSAIVMVHTAGAETVAKRITEFCKAANLHPSIELAIPSAGAHSVR